MDKIVVLAGTPDPLTLIPATIPEESKFDPTALTIGLPEIPEQFAIVTTELKLFVVVIVDVVAVDEQFATVILASNFLNT